MWILIPRLVGRQDNIRFIITVGPAVIKLYFGGFSLIRICPLPFGVEKQKNLGSSGGPEVTGVVLSGGFLHALSTF